MGEITAVPILVLIAALWAFLKFQPIRGTPHMHRTFNLLVLGLGALLWTGWFFSVSFYLERMGLLKYQILLGLGLAAAVAVVYLGIFFLIRNFWLFADRNRPGRW